MNSYCAISPRSSLSNERQRRQQQQQWRKGFPTGGVTKTNTLNSEENYGFQAKQHFNNEDSGKNLYTMYGGKYRKSAVKTDPRNGQLKSVLKCRDSGEENVNNSNPYERGYDICGGCNARHGFDKKAERDYLEERRKYKYLYKKGHKENDVGWYKSDDDDNDEVLKQISTKKGLVEEFRRIYRRVEVVKAPKPFVRTDMMAWKEMEKRYDGMGLYPIQTVGVVPGVEIGDEFGLRLELIIMGIHLQMVHGIDTMATYPYGTLLATSVVATEGYSDNMIDSSVLMYVGEGGTFEGGGSNKGKSVKDQVMKGGNLGLKNSMKARTEVRVVRGVKRGRSSKTVFVYDGLYKVVDCFQSDGVCGNKQFVFKLVRCPGQKHIVWAKYK